MKKLLYISLAIFATLFLIIQNASAAWYNPFTWGQEKNVGASVLFPYQGGTGIGSVTAGDVGNCLAVADDAPFRWEVVTCGSGGGGVAGAISTTTPLVNTYVVYSTGVASIGNDAGMTYSAAGDRLTVVNASTTNFSTSYASSTIANFGTLFTGLSNGFAYIGSGGKLNSLASSSILLQDLGGAVTDSQVPDSITVTLAGTATALAANGANCSAGSFPLGVDASGAVESCAAVSISGITNGNNLADLTATDSTLTFSGAYNGGTARTVGLNLGNANTWTVLQTFNYSSTTGQASFANASSTEWVGGGLQACNATTGKLNWDATTKQFKCDTDQNTGGGTSAFEIATTSDIALSQLAYISKTGARTTLASVATSTLGVASSLLSSGTLGYQVGGTNSSLSINTANANTWTAKQDFFGAASSTLFSSNWLKVGGTASTTIDGAGNVALPAAGTLTIPALTSALTLTGAGGELAEYAGTSCTNQFVRSLSALGVATCATVANTDLANSTISGISLGSNLADLTATNSTLTFSGSYNGGTARNVGLNLGNANTWTAASTDFSNYLRIGTTTSAIQYQTVIASSTAPQISLSAGAGIAQWAFRNAGGNLYFSTTTVVGTATTSTSALSLLNTGEVIVRNLFQIFNVAGTKIMDVAGSAVTLLGTWDFSGATVKIHTYPAFTYATSTAWSGTTTIPLAPAYTAENFAGVKCFTDTGTLNVSFNDGTNRMDMLNASTTVGSFTFSTNNTFTAGEKRYVDIGTPASSPTKISCSVDRIVNN